MIMEKKNNSLRYVAGACFGIRALIYINSVVRNMQDGYRLSPWTLISIVGCALIAVSMFASVDILTSVGGGILAVGAARRLILDFGRFLDFGRYGFYPKRYLIADFIWLVVCILFVVIGLNRKNAKTICIVAGALLAVGFLVVIFGALCDKIYYDFFPLGFIEFLRNVIEIVGTIMMGLALNIDDAQDSSSKTASTSGIHSRTPTESQMDRLAKLKDLLDNGVISQEEFDSKKKQILGQ